MLKMRTVANPEIRLVGKMRYTEKTDNRQHVEGLRTLRDALYCLSSREGELTVEAQVEENWRR